MLAKPKNSQNESCRLVPKLKPERLWWKFAVAIWIGELKSMSIESKVECMPIDGTLANATS